MSQPTLESTPIGINTTNGTTSPIYSIPVRTKTPEPTPLTQPTELPGKNGKAHVPDDPDPDPSFSDSSSKKKKRDKNKSVVNTRKMIRQTHHRSTILIRTTSVITDTNDIRGRATRKKYSIKLCARLTEKFLTTAYKSKIIRFKMDEYPLQCRICFPCYD